MSAHGLQKHVSLRVEGVPDCLLQPKTAAWDEFQDQLDCTPGPIFMGKLSWLVRK